MANGTQISDMIDSGTDFPEGSFVPFVVETQIGGLSPLKNYRYDLGKKLKEIDDEFNGIEAAINLRVTYADLISSAGNKGTSLITHLDEGDDAVGVNLRSYLNVLAANPFQFGAVGDGVANDGPALQKWLDSAAPGGRTLLLPAGYDFSTEQLLLLEAEDTTITGGGTISVPSRIVGLAPDGSVAGVITITEDGCTIDGITVSNPSQERSATGTQSLGIQTCANDTRIVNCTVLDFEYGITLSAMGEYYDWWVDRCYARVNGVGQLGGAYGEDRGDGITGWGARMHITNNRIVALAGTQARGAIFVESLADITPDDSGLDANTTAVITGNIVGIADQTYPIANPSTGNFRRGIDSEQISRVTIGDNIIRSCAWFGVQVAGPLCNSALVHDNIILCDTPAGDTNGASFSPIPAGMSYYPNGDTDAANIKFVNNLVYITTAQCRGFVAQGINTSVCANLSVESNQVFATVDMGSIDGMNAIDFAAGTRMRFVDNEIYGAFRYGIGCSNSPEVEVVGGEYSGQDIGLSLQTTVSSVTGGLIRDCIAGIQTSNTAATLDGVRFRNVSGNEIAIAATTTLLASNCIAEDGGGTIDTFVTPTVSRWRGMIGWAYLSGTSTYDPASVAAGANGGVSGNITVTGAAAGDRVTARFSLVTGGLIPVAAVSAADTVIAGFVNPTAGPVDLNSGTMTVSIERG